MNPLEMFGFNLTKKKDKPNIIASVVPPSQEDGASIVSAASYYGLAVDLDGNIKNENQLIRKYRETAQYPDCDAAVEDIINEAIVYDTSNPPIEIVLDDVRLSDSIKTKITDEFKEVLRLLKFHEKGHDIFRSWYIDGRIYYNILIDEANKKNGISELRYIDPQKIRKVKSIKKGKNANGLDVTTGIEEYYLYNDKGLTAQTTQGIKMSMDSVAYCSSGLFDPTSNTVLSYMHKAIKPTNQLKMMEDSAVIYRVARAPERRIFYIDVGNLPKMKAEQYVQDIMNKFRNKLVYDANTGEIKDDKKHLCLTMDTKVPLLDGRTLSLSEISEEYKDKELWAYSCDPITGKFAPGLITWAGVSRPDAEVMRLTLDNGKTIDCTPDHTFPVWDKNLVQAKDLLVGDSMIPLYKRNHPISSGKSKDYEQVWTNDTKEWKYTHRLVSNWKGEVGIDNHFLFNETYADSPVNTVHHKNINRFDNSPNNLTLMNNKDHICYHRHASSLSGVIGGRRAYELGVGIHNKLHPNYREWQVNAGLIGGRVSSDTGKSQENLAKGREIFADLIVDSEYNEWFRQHQREGWTEDKRDVAAEHAKRNNLSARGNLAQKEQWKTQERQDKHHTMYAVEYRNEMFDVVKLCASKKMSTEQASNTLNSSNKIIEQWQLLNNNKRISPKQKTFDRLSNNDVNKIAKEFSGLSFAKLKEEQQQFRNHKITKIEYLKDRVDTGCLTIDGNELYHNHHTFALASGIYTKNSMMEDFWMPRREGGKGTEIATLDGAQNLGEVTDLEYFQNKLFQSLSVPITRLKPDTGFSLGQSSTISRDEIKFSKFISRLRIRFSSLLSDILRIQLVSKGILLDEEWTELCQVIRYDYNRDNHFEEMKNAEIMQNRLNTIQLADAYVGRYFSIAWLRKNVLLQSEDDYKEIDAEMQAESAMLAAQEQQQLQQEQK